jgi:4-hydroxy-tetrahydrodipicolinate synthase
VTYGVYPAAVTPFDERGRVDLPGVARLLSWFSANGCKGVVLAGTNGEGPSLSAPEKRELVRSATPVAEHLGLEAVLGIATSSLEEAVWLCKQAADAGCGTVLLMPPAYYREASEMAIERWFLHVLDRSAADVLLYNFPKRTGITLTPDLIGRLAGHARMIGIKDSSGSRENLSAYAAAVPGKLLYVGDEMLLPEALTAGWTGTISGAANVLARWLSQICSEWQQAQDSAEAKFEIMKPALSALRSLPQPAANKKALELMGVLERADVRLPLDPWNEVADLRQALDLAR